MLTDNCIPSYDCLSDTRPCHTIGHHTFLIFADPHGVHRCVKFFVPPSPKEKGRGGSRKYPRERTRTHENPQERTRNPKNRHLVLPEAVAKQRQDARHPSSLRLDLQMCLNSGLLQPQDAQLQALGDICTGRLDPHTNAIFWGRRMMRSLVSCIDAISNHNIINTIMHAPVCDAIYRILSQLYKCRVVVPHYVMSQHGTPESASQTRGDATGDYRD